MPDVMLTPDIVERLKLGPTPTWHWLTASHHSGPHTTRVRGRPSITS